MAWLQQQQQLILRLPDHLSRISRKLLNKERGKTSPMVEVRPQDENDPANDFIFVINGKEYPALLMNLPTPLETHKTFDNKIFLKAGDIGQVLQVFDTAEEREVARNKICKTLHGDYMPSGVTPPTADIVKRRFELTRKNETFLPYRIRAVIEEISGFGNGTGRMVPAHSGASAGSSGSSSSGGGGVGNGNASGAMLEVVCESTTEEVVDFQEWMVDSVSQSRRTGVSITLSGSDFAALKDIGYGSGSSSSNNARLSNTTAPLLLLLQHPDILVTEEEREEDQIDALAAEQVKEQRRKNSISLSADEQVGERDQHMDVEETTAPTGSASLASGAGRGGAGGGSGEEASDIRAAEPLKLSLSVRRQATTTTATATTTGAGTSASQAPTSSNSGVAAAVANNTTTAAASSAGVISGTSSAAARATGVSDRDVEMLEDEEGDENDADSDGNDGAENDQESDEEEPDTGGTIFDMLDDSDGDEGAGAGDGAEEMDGEDDYSSQQPASSAQDGHEGVITAREGKQHMYSGGASGSREEGAATAATSEQEEQDGGGEGYANLDDDADSVNSNDSDAWMREV